MKTVYESLLKDLGLKAKDVPLLAGEVVNADQGGVCASMNNIIRTLPQVVPTAAVVSFRRMHVRYGLVTFRCGRLP